MFQKVFDDTTNFEIYAFVLDLVQGIAEETVVNFMFSKQKSENIH